MKILKEELNKLGILNKKESKKNIAKIGRMEDEVRLIKSKKDLEKYMGISFEEIKMNGEKDGGDWKEVVESLERRETIILYERWFKFCYLGDKNGDEEEADKMKLKVDKLVKELRNRTKNSKLWIEMMDEGNNWENKISYYYDRGRGFYEKDESII